jgi:hypothetical protein
MQLGRKDDQELVVDMMKESKHLIKYLLKWMDLIMIQKL